MENHRMLSTPAAAAVGSSGRIRWCRRSPCGGDSTPSTRPASCARQISSRSRGNAAPCSVAKASTRRTCQCGDAALAGLVPKRRRRKTNPNAPLVAENQRLVRENARLMKRLRQTEAVRNVPKKLSEILGLQLPPNDYVTEPRKRLRNLPPPWAAVACEAIAVPRPASPRGFECRRMEARSGCLSRRVVCRQGSR